MKQIIIFLLIVILAVIGYGQYSKFQRFSLKNYGYESPEGMDVSKANPKTLLDYHEAVEAVNGYVITQWSAHKIDVRNPKKDNEKTRAAVAEYRKKLAAVHFYEQQIALSATSDTTQESTSKTDPHKDLIREMFAAERPQSIRAGARGALVYEIQKLLIAQGYDIPLDGIYRSETINAIQNFEQEKGLYIDGVLDAITFHHLLDSSGVKVFNSN